MFENQPPPNKSRKQVTDSFLPNSHNGSYGNLKYEYTTKEVFMFS